MKKNQIYRCPNCKKTTTWKDNPFRPFCSERCKLIDLGDWATGRYAIYGEKVNSEDTEERGNNGK